LIFFTNNRPQDTPDSGNSSKETITERVHRHLKDKNSEITEEDIKNALVEWDVRRNVYEEFLALTA